MANEEKVDLIMALKEYDASRKAIEKLLNQADPTVGVLALEGLFRIKNQRGGRQREKIRSFLRRWRNDNRSGYSRMPILKKALRELTIFKTYEVPLFIDDYGDKNLLSSYEITEEAVIDPMNVTIYHVTHLKEAMSIAINKELRGSDNKNVMEGCWFGIDLEPEKPESVYGSRYFETTLSKLGVGGLRQGEIVSYKRELNVILYADDEVEDDAEGVKKPTAASARENHNRHTYVKVSIFVPKRFLPSPDKFHEVISGPYKVEHVGFCVRQARTSEFCFELDCNTLIKDVRRKEDPVSIIDRIKLWWGAPLEQKIRAFFDILAESCLPDSSLSKKEQCNHLATSFKYGRQLLEAFESAFLTSKEASGDQTGAEECYETLMKAVEDRENPATIIQKITLWSGPTHEEKITAFFKLLSESCLLDSSDSSWENDPLYGLEASTEYRRQLLDAFESVFTISKQASGDQTVGYKTLMKALSRKEDPAAIIQMMRSWSGPKVKEKIRAFFNLLAESCVERLVWRKTSFKYGRQLLRALERGCRTSKQASGDEGGAERDDDDDTDGGTST